MKIKRDEQVQSQEETRIQEVAEQPQINTAELEKWVEEATQETLEQEEIDEQTIKEFEELQENIKSECKVTEQATKQDIEDIKSYIAQSHLDLKRELIDCHKDVNTRNAEYINLLKLIFDRLKFIKGRIGKWFLISSLVLAIGSGVTFTTIFYHWDNIEPKLDKILGVAKAANSVAKLGGQ